MTLNVIVNGAKGKMGQEACKAIEAHPQLTLVAGLSKEDSLRDAIKALSADIVVELTRADCVYENAEIIIKAGAHPVIGTSGLVASQIQSLTSLAQSMQLGGIIAPNFSIGAVLMMQFSALASRFFTEVEIIETHHQQKLDAPSGTALKTAEMIACARRNEKNPLFLKELVPGARGGVHQEVPIHSVRLPGFIANQQVIFGQSGESLTITHNSIDRASFMPGVILSCLKVSALTTLVYGLETLILE